MDMLDATLLILGLITFLGSFMMIVLILYGFIKTKNQQPPVIDLKVSIIVPCKGIVENLEQNLKAICEQKYPHYNVIFVVDSQDDPAYPFIEKIIKNRINASVEFSQKIEGASGKISALISGLKKTDDVDVYVFADSDIKPHKEWLAKLVTYLSDDKVGATTGFRWFFPKGLKSYLTSTWNMVSMSGFFHSKTNCAWGGSTAIKKSLFEKLKIKSKWVYGFSDDLILTDAVKNAGLIIKLVPSCVVESSSETRIRQFLKWGTQQFTWIRWYRPFIWYAGLIGIILLHALMTLGFILIFTGFTIPGILMISPIILEMIYGMTEILVLRKLMYYPKENFGSILPYIFLLPIVGFLIAYNYVLSGFKKEIKWCGKYYTKEDALKNNKKIRKPSTS
jgi:cellulose synthase/poly-beta-1,6-N-acetylglucosamine synthase-like glycosyltransferase